MRNLILDLPAKYLMGKGIDKHFPFLVDLYKRVSVVMAKKGETEVPRPLNTKLLVSNKDAGLGLFLRMKGEYEPLETAHLTKTIKKGDTVFDIGANIGIYTILASKLVGPRGKVYAFEPDPENYRLLIKNIKLNKLENVVAVKSALGDKTGRVRFYQDISNPGESSLAELYRANRYMVSITTLDKFCSTNHIKRIQIIKMDVEGGEIDILNGGKKVLEKMKNITIYSECNPEGLLKFARNTDDFITAFRTTGFKITSFIDEQRRMTHKFTQKSLNDTLRQTAYVTVIAKK